MNDAFERELLSRLREQFLLRPAMQPQDAVKFVFQGLLGVGHLLASRKAVTACITREMDGAKQDASEELCEKLSPGWCRLNLRRAKAEGLGPDAIAGLMLTSRSEWNFTRSDVLKVCEKLSSCGGKPFDRRELASVLDENRLPSHSETYRETYRPAYRVISADWLPYLNAVLRINDALSGRERLTVTIDGPCASGKTMLPEETLPDSRTLIIEGCYCNLPQISGCADVRLFLDAPWEEREQRLAVRETAASLNMFYEKWIPLENAYFEAFRLPDSGMELISIR